MTAFRPTDQTIDLLQSFDDFLREANQTLVASHIDLSDFPQRVATALFWQLLQLGQTVSVVIRNGYAGEAPLVTRPMLSAAVNIMYIAESDSAIRAWWYQLHLEPTEARRIDRLELHEMITPAEAQTARQTHAAKWVRAHAEARILQLPDPPAVDSPLSPGQPGLPTGLPARARARPTWSRASDRKLFDQVGKGEWYDLHYATSSDESHVNAVAVAEFLGNIGRGQASQVGPQEQPAWLRVSILVAIDAICQSLLHMDRRWSLDIAEHVRALCDTTMLALETHKRAP